MRRWPRLERILAATGLLFMGCGLVLGWSEIVSGFSWSPMGFAFATAASFLGIAAVAASWASLHEEQRRSAFGSYLSLQPAKHIPGGVAHPLGLISASSPNRGTVGGIVSFVRFSLALVSGASLIAGVLVVDPATRLIGALALVMALVVGTMVASDKPMKWLAGRLGRLSRLASREVNPAVTAQRVARSSALLALLFAAGGILGLALSFAIIARAFGDLGGLPVLLGSFSAAWVVGYVLVPFPAGLGVREATLVFIFMGTGVPAGPVLAAATLHRVAQFLAEAVGTATGYGVSRGQGGGRGEVAIDDHS